MPDMEAQRALWDVTQEATARAGLPAYEVSNHARPGAKAATIWSIGAMANMQASDPARMAA